MSVKVLQLITGLRHGGAENVVAQLALGLDRERYDVSVAGLVGGELADELRGRGVSVHVLGMRSKLDLGVSGRLARLLRSEGVDILHTHLFHANLIGRLAARAAHTRLVISTVHVDERRLRGHLVLDRLTQGLCDAEVCVSEAVADFTHRRAKVDRAKLTVIRDGINLAPFTSASGGEKVRLELGIAPDAPLIVTVARLTRQKGLPHLIDAMLLVRDEVPEVRLVIAGRGEMRDQLQHRIDSLGLSGCVSLLGFRHDVPALLAAADVFVLPSLWEGLGLAAVEAQAAGLPVVASDVGGLAEAIDDGVTGLLSPPGNVEELAENIVRLLRDGRLRDEMGARGRQRAVDLFSAERMVAETEALYERLLAERGPAA